MSQSIEALVNPILLVWARQQAGYTLEQVAKRLGQKHTGILTAWERGEKKPSIRQARELAKMYHRPLSVLYMAEPPEESPLAAEYRRLPGLRSGEESPELRLALRQMLNKREVALDLYEELRAQPHDFDLEIHPTESTEEAGIRLRTALRIPISEQLRWKDEFEGWRKWRAAVESLGILVFQFSGVALEEVRGLSLLKFPLPVIGVNSKEITQSKPFTLMHELVHLMLSLADEEKAALEDRLSNASWETINRFAERVAAAILLPSASILSEESIARHPANATWDLHEIRKLARRYKITPTAFATRLLDLGKMTPATYGQWKAALEAFQRDHPPKSGGGMASPAEKAINRNGRPFTALILEALQLDRITSVDAANYMNLRFSHFGDLQREIAGPMFAR